MKFLQNASPFFITPPPFSADSCSGGPLTAEPSPAQYLGHRHRRIRRHPRRASIKPPFTSSLPLPQKTGRGRHAESPAVPSGMSAQTLNSLPLCDARGKPQDALPFPVRHVETFAFVLRSRLACARISELRSRFPDTGQQKRAKPLSDSALLSFRPNIYSWPFFFRAAYQRGL